MDQHRNDAPNIIELDDPAPRGARLLIALALLAVIALVLAPFLIDRGPAEEAAGAPPTRVSASRPEICRPSVSVPKLLEPVAGVALPSWMRICDWVIEPAIAEPLDPQN